MSKQDQPNHLAGRAPLDQTAVGRKIPEPHPLAASGALLDPKAAAAFLDLSEWTLAEWRCRGNGPRYFKISNRVRYSLAELNIWLEARSVVSTSEHDAKKAR